MPRLFVEHLTVIDCAYLDMRRGLVGESWIVDLELHGALDAQSMVLDFSAVKRLLKQAIDASADHTLLVPRRAEGLILDEAPQEISLLFRSDVGIIEHHSPLAAVSLVDAETINIESVRAYLLPRLESVVQPSVERIGLQLRQEVIDGAWYHYCHGLKKHAGHCQRIAHGHRSRLQIQVDGRRDTELEHQCAAHWNDIHLSSREDLLTHANGRLRFGYDAAEGRFELALPEPCCDLLDSDTTVECIADHLAQVCAQRRPGSAIEVRAYEGVMKGAIASHHP